MKKLINAPEQFVDETIEGVLFAHPDRLDCVDGNLRCIIRKNAGKKKKVALSKKIMRLLMLRTYTLGRQEQTSRGLWI